jgi:hypothetical protein
MNLSAEGVVHLGYHERCPVSFIWSRIFSLRTGKSIIIPSLNKPETLATVREIENS